MIQSILSFLGFSRSGVKTIGAYPACSGLELLENLKRQIPGCSITLSDSTKRSEGEWHSRWTFVVRDCNVGGTGERLFESPWFGYETLNEAISALSECLECYTKTSEAQEEEQ
jgi:hypothetical protein